MAGSGPQAAMYELWLGDGPFEVDMPTVCTADQAWKELYASPLVASPSAYRREMPGSANVLSIKWISGGYT